MTFWNPDNIRAACGGTWLVRPAQIELPKDRPADLPLPDLYAPITGVNTDTRTIAKGQMFIALRGENFDGHKFVADAVRAGAPIVIIDDLAAAPSGGVGVPGPANSPSGWGGCGVMKVADTGKALLRIAAAYRESLKRTKVIAVCGSNGKTTTTKLIDHLLGHGAGNMRGTASRKSFNNAVGVPLTILSAKENDQYLICEVGTNHPGEIAILGDVVRPDIAVITSIGREHLEGLGSLAGVAKEEAAIIKYAKSGGWIVATDAPEIAEYLRPIKNQVTFGRSPKAALRLTAAKHEVADGRAWLSFTINGRQHGRLPLVGEHNALNAIAALAVARRMGVDEQKSLSALQTAGGADMRLETVQVGGRTILNDAYNANPDSMIAGIETLLALRSAGFGESGGEGRAVCVLGEMLELGDASAACHRSVAQALVEKAKSGAATDLVVLVGAGMKHAAAALAEEGWPADRVRHFESADGPNAAEIAGLLAPGDLVLVKGSRRVRLERVVAALKEKGGEPTVAIRAPGQVEGKTGTLAGAEGRLG